MKFIDMTCEWVIDGYYSKLATGQEILTYIEFVKKFNLKNYRTIRCEALRICINNTHTIEVIREILNNEELK